MVLVLAPGGCDALISDPGGDFTQPPPTSSRSAGSTQLRRLSNVELANAIETLTGTRPAALGDLPNDVADAHSLFFAGLAGRQPQVPAARWLEIASQAAGGMTPQRIAEWAPACESGGGRGCAQELVLSMGRRAFRRSVDADELAAAIALYDAAGEHDAGLHEVVRFILMSPAFLFVIEQGAGAETGVPLPLTAHEMATRLALALCDDLPDEALLRAAEMGELESQESIRAHAAQLLDQCGAPTIERFFEQWLGLGDVTHLERDPMAYPELNPSLNAAMIDETHRFLRHQVWDADARLADLFRADYSFFGVELGELYGVEGLEAGPSRVTLPPERRGLLTQASVLSWNQGAESTRPVQRGVYVLTRILCQQLEPPPDDVDATPRETFLGGTTRETYEALTSESYCASCHAHRINPVGFAFEDFDAIGRARLEENGVPIDASGGVPTLDIEGVVGGAELGEAIAARPELAACVARHWLRFALSRPEGDADALSREHVQAALETQPLREAFLSVVTTFAFRHRVIPTVGGE